MLVVPPAVPQLPLLWVERLSGVWLGDVPLSLIARVGRQVFVTEGRQRSAREIFDLLEEAGFAAPRLTMTAEGYALVEATKP